VVFKLTLLAEQTAPKQSCVFHSSKKVTEKNIYGAPAISMTDCQGLTGTSTICHVSRENSSYYFIKYHRSATDSWYYCLSPSVSKTTKRIWLIVL